jgi:DNA-binding LytR/AlgR family response regulator
MKILILEDEPLLAKNIARLVLQILPDAQILAQLASNRETSAWLESHEKPDLILADIQLSDGVSFKSLEKLNDLVPIIFTTAFDEYALKAFRMNSVDYLLKPIEREELERAIKKLELLKIKYSNQSFGEELISLFKGEQKEKTYKTKFLVYSGKSILPVHDEDIVLITKQEIIFLNDQNGKQYVTEFRSLDEVMELLNPGKFFRANRQFIVQEAFIDRFETDYTGKIHLRMKSYENQIIVISKDKAAEFKRWLEQ